MFLYKCVVFNFVCLKIKRRNMFSPEFMRFLINYQKPDKSEFETKKEIKFKDKDNNGNLAYVLLTNK